jgi:hypothetical protein
MWISMVRLYGEIHIPAKGELYNLILSEVEKTTKREATYLTRRFNKVTATWNHKPKFVISRFVTGDDVYVQVVTDDKIYYFVDQGTSVRYAKMTDDFEPKTSPGWIGSRTGRGGLDYIDPRHPRPGIVARNWTEAIYSDRQDKFNRNVYRAVERALKKYWR